MGSERSHGVSAEADDPDRCTARANDVRDRVRSRGPYFTLGIGSGLVLDVRTLLYHAKAYAYARSSQEVELHDQALKETKRRITSLYPDVYSEGIISTALSCYGLDDEYNIELLRSALRYLDVNESELRSVIAGITTSDEYDPSLENVRMVASMCIVAYSDPEHAASLFEWIEKARNAANRDRVSFLGL